MANANNSQEFQETQTASSSFLPSGSVPDTSVLDILGYEMSTSLEERIDAQYTSRPDHLTKSSKKHKKKKRPDHQTKSSKKHKKKYRPDHQTESSKKQKRKKYRKEVESDRRGKLKEHTKRLITKVSSSYSEKLPLIKCLGKAIDCIKDLKCESTMLTAERYWFILENQELVEYLRELQEHHGVLCSPKLWEDGRMMQDWRDSRWDVHVVPEAEKSRGVMDVHVHEMYTNQYLENVRRQKMQLHAEYASKRDDRSDAVQYKMGSGKWCWDRRCPAAPHRIHYGGVRREVDDSWWIPPVEEEDGDDDGWLEDDDKMELDGNKCPAESFHRPCYCPKKPPVDFVSETSTSAPETMNNDFPDEKKVKKRMRSKSKKEFVAPAFKIVTHELDNEDTYKGLSVPAKATADPKTSVSKDTGSSVSDGSKLMVGAVGKLIKLNLLDPSLANKQFYLLQLEKKQGETQKTMNPKSHLQVNLKPIGPGKAVLVCKSAAQANVGGKMVSGQGNQTVTISKPQVVFGSGNTMGLKSETGKTKVDGNEALGPVSVRNSQHTGTSFKPRVVPESTSTTCLNAQKGKPLIPVDAKVVSRPADGGHNQHTIILGIPQVLPGSISTTDVNSQKGKTQGDAKVVSGPVRVGERQHTVSLFKPQVDPGSTSTMGLKNSQKGKAQVDDKVVSEPSSVWQGQRTLTKSRNFLTGSSSLGNVDSREGNPNVDAKMASGYPKPTLTKGKCRVGVSELHDSRRREAHADGKVVPGNAYVGHTQPTVTQAKHQEVPGSVSVMGWDFSKGNMQVDVGMVSGQPTVGYTQPTVTKVRHETDPGSGVAMELDSREVKTQDDADMSEEADKSSSPISCMLCDKPFDNMTELQSHLINSHAS